MTRLTLSILMLLLALALTACRTPAPVAALADRLYALRLDHAPTAADWDGALARVVVVKGGRVHKLNPLPDIDSDTVHVTTASCHHGATLPAPLHVDVRAFYTERDLYLRLSWEDASRDDNMRQWRFDGKDWQSSPAMEDGFGVLWDAAGRFPKFTCSYACHIDDFGVTGANFHANNRMKLARDSGEWLDLWNWKAGRTGRFGFVDDRYLDHQGMHGDTPGELFLPNSRARLEQKGEAEIFGPADTPIYDSDSQPVGKEFRPAGSLAPGYITERPLSGRADIVATSEYNHGRWTVVLRRALDSGDPHDVRFVPGARTGTAFGLSIMDDTLKEHYASVTPEYLVLLPRQGELRTSE